MSKRRFSSPWWIVLGALLGMIVSQASVLTYTFTLFIKPIGAEFGWGRGTLSAANSSYIICMALTLPFVGALMDRYPPLRKNR